MTGPPLAPKVEGFTARLATTGDGWAETMAVALARTDFVPVAVRMRL